MAPRKKTPEEQVRDILMKATPTAAKLLAQTLKGEETTYQVRLDCAKEILNRVYGKGAGPAEEEKETRQEIRIVWEEEALEQAQ